MKAFVIWPLAILVQTSDSPRVYPGSTCKIEQLTGERDVPRGVLTRSRTQTSAGLSGTDLGSSFEHEGKLYFLFGDSGGGRPDADVLAWSAAQTPDALALSFHTDDKGRFRALEVPGITSGAFEVPSYGISLDGTMFVVFTTGHSDKKTMGRSVLAASKDDGRTFERVFDLSNARFVNVALARARAKDHASLPSADSVFVWGSGDYRASSPRLAYAPSRTFAERATWRYYAGTKNGAPQWAEAEGQSVDLFDHPVVGEVSVAWIAPLERWVMLYNSSAPRGIVMRTARHPWGPWSEAEVVFDPWLDKGYANFMHVSWRSARMDEFHDGGRQDEWGGEYGPYLIPRFASGNAERCTLVFTMSTWNPYQVVLMSTDVGRPPRDAGVRETRLLPGTPPFSTQGSDVVRFERNGIPHVSTHGAQGDKDRVVSHTSIRATLDSSLTFFVHGGRSRIVLVREEKPPPSPIADLREFAADLLAGKYGSVVESIAGPATNEVDVSVRWNLSRHAGQRLRLYLVDAETSPWGFVSVSEVTLCEARGVR